MKHKIMCTANLQNVNYLWLALDLTIKRSCMQFNLVYNNISQKFSFHLQNAKSVKKFYNNFFNLHWNSSTLIHHFSRTVNLFLGNVIENIYLNNAHDVVHVRYGSLIHIVTINLKKIEHKLYAIKQFCNISITFCFCVYCALLYGK